ncbi:siderophore-interacting protein [Pseudoclavibacter sp. CFCC 14310]|nr:siderophore-interacting protein [Pseudoclavibacter sp. CFCC 14310]
MARYSTMRKPTRQQLLRLEVVRTEQISAHWMRVTLGGGQSALFEPMGFDQWFRLFIPAAATDDAREALDRVPANANKTMGYFKFLATIPQSVRPIMRNYSVRAFRPADLTAGRTAEIDVDFVLHGSAEDGTAGPASTWAQNCQPGDPVALIDEGIVFNPEQGTDRVLLVSDETGLPAISSICESLPADAVGTVIAEVPAAGDALDFAHPAGVDVRWVVRETSDDPHVKPGTLALAALREIEVPAPPVHAFIVGEQALPTSARRHLVEAGVPKEHISFVGYWRMPAKQK